MTNKLRTLLFTLGSTTAVVAPIAAVVACGDTKPSDASATTRASDLWNKVFKTYSEVKVGSALTLGLRHNSLTLSLPVTSANEAELKSLATSTDQAGLIKRLGQLFFAVATDAQKQQGLSEVEVAGTIEFFITGVMPQQPSTGNHAVSSASLFEKMFGKSTVAVGDVVSVNLRGGSVKLDVTVDAANIVEFQAVEHSTVAHAIAGPLSHLFADKIATAGPAAGGLQALDIVNELVALASK